MKVTIVIPNLNGAGWLRDSIASVWAQTRQDFRLIVSYNAICVFFHLILFLSQYERKANTFIDCLH